MEEREMGKTKGAGCEKQTLGRQRKITDVEACRTVSSVIITPVEQK